MDRIEKAIYYTELEALLASQEDCDRVYFGHEFCQRLFPLLDEVKQAADHAAGGAKGFTLVTPYVTNAGLKSVQEVIDGLLGCGGKAFEVVVNDWGLLHWLHREHPEVPVALGRLLTKQKRGPRVLRITGRLPRKATDHFMRSNVDVPRLREFLESMAVQRVELDNLLQGMARKDGMSASLYYPYAYVSTTRLCLLARGDRPNKNLRSLGRCGKECQKYAVTLKHDDMPVPILLKGNTQFVQNDKLPDDLAALNITRLVHQPQIPA